MLIYTRASREATWETMGWWDRFKETSLL